ncbi:MAG: hypothetical protein K2X47_12500, partial [Bdellovibrionales bacterium]|nr:hypothetical protein [Bdellovibrionales bacterium]
VKNLPTLLIGDFNLPAVWSAGYSQILKANWQDTFVAQSTSYSFPTPSSGERTAVVFGQDLAVRMKIDHSLVRSAKASSVILPMVGSDHFPIWTTIAP